MRSAPPQGPKIITKLYKLRRVRANEPYCETCRAKVTVVCPNGPTHGLHKQQQKGVDIGIATLALTHSAKYDTLILSSGDGDLLDAVEHLTEIEGKRLELLVFRYGVSTDLQSRADHIYWIDDFAQDVVQERKEPAPALVSESQDDLEAATADEPARD